jgi:hypothetical protein
MVLRRMGGRRYGVWTPDQVIMWDIYTTLAGRLTHHPFESPVRARVVLLLLPVQTIGTIFCSFVGVSKGILHNATHNQLYESSHMSYESSEFTEGAIENIACSTTKHWEHVYCKRFTVNLPLAGSCG